jgi:HEAT repeat protein
VPVLDVVALVLSAGSVLMLIVLVVRRVRLSRVERRHDELEDQLRPLTLALLESGEKPDRALSSQEEEILADQLGRYARLVTGSSHERIVEYFDSQGTIARELAELANHRRPAWRRAAAAFRLGDIGNASAAGGLVAALGDDDRDVRIAAARSLGHLRAPEAVEPLLRTAGEDRIPEALAGWALLQIGPAALPTLRALLEWPEPRGRAAAVNLIGLLGGPGDAPAIEDRLRDSSARVRAAAARALGRLGAERALPFLVAALDDRIPAVRECAAVALEALRDPQAVDALAAHAEHDTFDVSHAAAQALAAVDLPAAEALARSTQSPQLREATDLARVR